MVPTNNFLLEEHDVVAVDAGGTVGLAVNFGGTGVAVDVGGTAPLCNLLVIIGGFVGTVPHNSLFSLNILFMFHFNFHSSPFFPAGSTPFLASPPFLVFSCLLMFLLELFCTSEPISLLFFSFL